MAMTLEQLEEARMQFYLHPVTNIRSRYKASIKDAFRLITDPNRYREITEQLRAIDDKKLRSEFKKQNFDILCPSGLFSKRTDSCLLRHSDKMGIDIDNYGTGPEVEGLKQEIIHDPMFRDDFELELAFRSPSGDGLKLVVETDLSVATHEEYFKALYNIFQMRYGIEIDANCKNVSRGCFLPYDPLCYVNPLVRPY